MHFHLVVPQNGSMREDCERLGRFQTAARNISFYLFLLTSTPSCIPIDLGNITLSKNYNDNELIMTQTNHFSDHYPCKPVLAGCLQYVGPS